MGDFTDDILTTGSVAVNGTAAGEIEVSFDGDWFAVNLIAGRVYQIELRGADTSDGTLPDPRIGGVYDHDGDVYFGTSNNDANGSTSNALVLYTAHYTGEFFIEARPQTGAVLGTYTLEVTDLEGTTSGTAPDDFIIGTSAPETLQGLAGDDTIFGLEGNDVIEGGGDNDSLVGGTGSDTLRGGDGADTLTALSNVGSFTDLGSVDQLFGGDGNDQLNGYGGHSQLFGEGGNDALTGGPGLFNQRLDGGTGVDTMIGQGGADTYVVDNIGDFAWEYVYDSYGPGNTATGDVDEIQSHITWALEQWNFDGFNIENLTLLGTGNTNATGNEVANVIVGNSGNNTIAGAEGDDTLTGGAGADVFVFSPGGGHDTIADFESGVDVLSTSGWGGTPTSVETTDANGFRVFTFNGDTSVTLQGVFPNRPPEFTSVPPATVNEDEVFTYALGAFDPDGDAVTIASASWPDWIGVVNGILTGTPTQANVGTSGNDFSFLISDGRGGAAEQNFTLEVLNVNDDPTFETTPELSGTEDILYSYTPTFDDEDGDTPTVDETGNTLPGWLTYNPVTGTFSGTPTQSDGGNQDVTIAIVDGQGGTATQEFTINVATVNDVPTAVNDTASVTEDTPLIISNLLNNDSDPDGDTLTISAVTQGAQGSVVNNNDGTVTYTPGSDLNGADTFTYTISDGNGETDTATVVVTIDPVNDDPTFGNAPSETASVGSLYSFLPVLQDADGDNTTADLGSSDLPGWLSYNAANGTFSGTPAQTDLGTPQVTIAIQDGNGGTNTLTYDLEVSPKPDDFAASTATTGTAVLGGPSLGEIEVIGDEDWFAVALEAGREYLVQVIATVATDGRVVDPALAGIYDSNGTFLGFGNDDWSNIVENSESLFRPMQTGTYYIAAMGPPEGKDLGILSDTGAYSVEVYDQGPVDIASLTQTFMSTNAVNEGDDLTIPVATIVPSEITLPLGTTGPLNEYIAARDISVDLTGSTATESTDFTFSYEFGATQTLQLDALDDAIVEDDETVTAHVTGYIDWIIPNAFGGAEIASLAGPTVTGNVERRYVDLTLDATINSAPEGEPTPITDFTFTVPEIIGNVLTNFTDGSGEAFEVTPFMFDGLPISGEILANGDISITDSSAGEGTSVLIDFTVTDTRGAQTQSQQEIVFGTDADDYLPGPTATQFGSIQVGTSEIGNVESAEDRDRFVVQLDAGQVYSMSLVSEPTSNGTLPNPEIFGLFDSLGELVANTSDNDSGSGQNALVQTFVVENRGQFEIEVGSFTSEGTGGYELSIVSLGAADDYLPGIFADVFGNVTVNTPTSGTIEADGDRDRFDVTLQAGVVYSISMEGIATGGGSLVNPNIIGLFDSLGRSVANGADDDSGVGSNALVEGVVVDADGTYQIEVASAGDTNVGDYTLTVEFAGDVDDFLPGISSGFGTVAINGRAIGDIETSGDIDGFRVSLQANTTYKISILGSASNNGTLVDPNLVGIFSSSNINGTPVTSVQTLNTQFVGDDSVSFFAPQSAGEFFIGVQDEFGGTGTYTVAIDNIGVRDDFAANIETTGSITPGGNATGSVDFAQDEDWFEVTLAANRLYQIDLVPNAGGNALADPFFKGVYDSTGALFQNTENDDGGADNSSQLQFVTDVAGTFYLAAGGFGETTGQYRLELNDLGPLDDNAFDITIEYTSEDTPNSYINAFEDAVERWEEIITGDLDYGFVEGYGFIDDILIEVSVQDIDLVFEGVEQRILAIASVLDQRSDASSGTGALPTYSRIVLNSNEIGQMLNLDELAQNIIGRALGFGSLWEEFGLVSDIDGVATYVGSNGLREMDELSDDLNGQNVLEDGENGALATEYWSEANLDAELMTSSVEVRRPNAGPPQFGLSDNPISELTIAAMQDLGYVVDYEEADNFRLAPGPLTLQRVSNAQLLNIEAEAVPEAALLSAQFLADSGNTWAGSVFLEAAPFSLANAAAQEIALPATRALSAEGHSAPPTYTYYRENPFSEQSGPIAFTAENTFLLNTTGTSVLFLAGYGAEAHLIELSGTFDKGTPAEVPDVTGIVTQVEVFSAQGQRTLTLSMADTPIAVATLLAEWPSQSFDGDDSILVKSLGSTVTRINPTDADLTSNQIYTESGNDTVEGGSASELINGGSGEDWLKGNDGDDTLIAEDGNDTIDGGSGTDTAVYSGNQTNYTLTLSPISTVVTDRRTDGNGIDELIDMEFLDFDTDILGGPFNLGIFGGPAGLDPAELESFIELYIAYFNRAPDAIGLNFWGTAFATGTTLEEMATLFGPQDETLATYPPGTTNETFAVSVYNNVLGRTPDQAGIDFWVGQLDQGNVSRDQFILNVLQGAKSDLKPELGQDFVDQQLADRGYLENKIYVGAYFAVHKGMSDVDNAVAAMALFDGSESGISDAVNAIDGYHSAALDPADGEFLMPLVGVLDDPFSVA
ncbi:tandem-95 repeat protein [Sulfitobacter mediterraneus]|uniref:tandem-95 repeat protein n=1 Tax=Sulfitobacter mediterraneus TaxID=83219 RepID=UPI0021A5989F|nr:tandem-95 repeat protein [Sulfitobacter mediterraneus]UWR12343.1 tandem-95 repeat protein [Sulfitobacter mediterraneus]